MEVNPGMGLLTRSLLNGGRSGDVKEEWRAWEEGKGVTEEKKGRGKAKAKAKEGEEWPGWSISINFSTSSSSPDTSSEPSDTPRRPSLVVASEPSPQLLSRSFDYTPKPPDPNFPASISLDYQFEHLNLQQCTHEPNLILSESTAYRWPTLPGILSDPAVVSYLTSISSRETGGPGEAGRDGKRQWEDSEPPITIVAHIPDSVIGEQMLAQWIGSVVGGSQGRQWIWQWGRVRLAVLCAKGLYDVGRLKAITVPLPQSNYPI